jgi:hypothetical protein
MTRCFTRYAYTATLLLLLAAVLPAAGCVGAMTTVMYFLGANDIKAEYGGLRQKRVAVACRPVVDLEYRNSGVANDIARQLSQELGKNVSRIEMVDYRKVEQWTDENSWDDYLEVGRAVGADMVVGIDLEQFTIYQGQTLYQGKANYRIEVYDCASGELAYQKTPDQALWPPNSPIPASHKQEAQFRREFVWKLADQIARHFYDHDRYEHFAEDAEVLN